MALQEHRAHGVRLRHRPPLSPAQEHTGLLFTWGGVVSHRVPQSPGLATYPLKPQPETAAMKTWGRRSAKAAMGCPEAGRNGNTDLPELDPRKLTLPASPRPLTPGPAGVHQALGQHWVGAEMGQAEPPVLAPEVTQSTGHNTETCVQRGTLALPPPWLS